MLCKINCWAVRKLIRSCPVSKSSTSARSTSMFKEAIWAQEQSTRRDQPNKSGPQVYLRSIHRELMTLRLTLMRIRRTVSKFKGSTWRNQISIIRSLSRSRTISKIRSISREKCSSWVVTCQLSRIVLKSQGNCYHLVFKASRRVQLAREAVKVAWQIWIVSGKT